MGVGARLKHAWNAFVNVSNLETLGGTDDTSGPIYMTRPDRARLRFTSDKTLVGSILARMAIDCASVDVKHVRLDDQERYSETIRSGLNNCLTLEANIDQAAQAFMIDFVLTLLDKGVAAAVPVDTTLNPMSSGGWDVNTLRVGEVIGWRPKHVQVMVYNEKRGLREQITLPKTMVAVVENPLYSVMNEPSSTLQRLVKKLSILDAIDEQSGSGKLDVIIQLPYVVKSDSRRKQAEQRRSDIEFQLSGSKYGVAYTDGTEKITQLNRPVENNLLAQVQYLTQMLYGQLGITEAVMNGTADEPTMLNYMNRTIEPILTAVVQAMMRVFLTKTARTQGQAIKFFRDPFRLIPIGGQGGIADIADKLARNEVVTSNELRQVLGMKPSTDPNADQLRNSNMPQPNGSAPAGDVVPPDGTTPPTDTSSQSPDTAVMGQSFDEIDAAIDAAFADLGLDEGVPSDQVA